MNRNRRSRAAAPALRGPLVAAVLAALLAVLSLPAFSLAGGASDAPRNLEVGLPASSAGGCLKLTWEVDDPSGVTAYRVFRSKSRGSGFRQVFEGEVNATRNGLMDYVDIGLEDGSTYYYRVSLVGAGGRETGTTEVVRGELPLLRREQSENGGAPAYRGKRIVISVADQTIYFLEDEVLVKSHLCSTGVDSHPTPFGLFKVEYHDPALVSERYGDVICYWWMGFAPDIGMHAIPYDPKTKKYYGAGSLGRKASHGCVRQAVADAKWAYDWAPNGTRLEVIGHSFKQSPPPPKTPPITGGHGSQGVTQAATDWYMAEGCTSGGFDTFILMMNPTAQAANVSAEFMKPDGSVVNGAYSVDPFSRYTVHVDDIKGLEETEVSTHLRSDQPIVAERSMYFDYNGKLGGSDSVGVNAPANRWYLAEGYTGGEFDEFILVQNPGAQPGTVNVTYMRPDGATLRKDYAVGAHSRLSIHVDDIPELANAEVSARVKCDRPVVVERAQYFSYYGRDGGNTSTGVAQPAKTWYLAEGYTGGDFDEYVLIQNPGDAAGIAKVTFMLNGGGKVEKEYDLLPRSRFTIHVDDIPELARAEVSTLIEADVDVIAERSMYFVSDGRPGGSDAPGVAKPSRYWYLAEGYTGAGFDTYVLIMNPNDEKVTVDVNYLLPSGRISPAQYTVKPHSRYTVHVDTVEGLSNTELSTALTGSKPIICERAMYFSKPRD